MTSVMLGALVLAILVLALATPAYRRGGWVAMSEAKPLVIDPVVRDTQTSGA